MSKHYPGLDRGNNPTWYKVFNNQLGFSIFIPQNLLL